MLTFGVLMQPDEGVTVISVLGAALILATYLLEIWEVRILALLLLMGRWEAAWFRFRGLTWDTRIGWWLNARTERSDPLAGSMGPVKRDIFRREIDMEDNETVVKYWVKIIELSEKDVRDRMKFLTAPASDEDSRRGRSRRGRSDFHVERMRQYNFEKTVKSWNLVYPPTEWVEGTGDDGYRREHPKAGEPMPLNRQSIEDLEAHVSEQINDHIDALNEPPEELPEVRDEDGEIIDEAVESPLVVN